MTAARKHATYDDILALPDGVTGEIVFGVVEHLWLVDVDLHVLEVFQREDARWLRLGAFADDDGRLCRPEPFSAIEFDLGALFRPPVPAR